MAGGSIDTLFALLASLGESRFDAVARASKNAFKEAAIATGLAVEKEKYRASTNKPNVSPT